MIPSNTLSCIRSSHRRYHSFVAARVDEILSNTARSGGRWVPTAENVADDATRMETPTMNTRWLVGPELLYKPEAEWPIQAVTNPETTLEELVPILTVSSPQD